jgi:class 3 adenylate cyclase/tetratricopeptide (TPR) repeat protein/DNA-binding XRE family transcriptional regulator
MSSAERETFAALLKRFRARAHLTQEELAEAAGLSVRGISALERGVNRGARKDTIDLLAAALDLSAQERAQLIVAARQHMDPAGAAPATSAGETAADPDAAASTSPASATPAPAAPPASPGAAPVNVPVNVFMLADIRDYTLFTREHGDEAARRLATAFKSIAHAVVQAHEGQVLSAVGDQVTAAFASPRRALTAAMEMQVRFAEEVARDPLLPLRVGIGMDVGEAAGAADDYFGGAVNLASRLCDEARAGEVLVTEALAHLTGHVDGLAYAEHGRVEAKGYEPVPALRVLRADERPAEVVEASWPKGNYLGAEPDGPLVARAAELGQLTAALEEVAGGEARLVLLAGEPGIGKTRLAQELTMVARERGFLVATGRCYEQHETVPYYPFLEALTKAYAGAPASVRAELPRRWPDVARLLPDQNVGVPARPIGSGGQEEQQRLCWAVSGFVLALAERRPVALLLDDLHWGDSASVELFQHLVRHTPGHHVLLGALYRDLAVRRQQSLDVMLRTLGREHLGDRIVVKSLTAEGTAQLMAATMKVGATSRDFATLLHARTEGNPLFIQEVLRALTERGDVHLEGDRLEPRALDELAVPERVQAAIDERLARLSEVTQELLYEASVLGQTFGFDTLETMSGREEREIEEALAEATSAGLVYETGKDGYAFNHALTQRTLYKQVAARKRRRLHRAAGEALERQPERIRRRQVAALAWHFLQGDDPERALPYMLAAGDESEAGFAHREAERQYETAIELARELEQPEREAEAREKLGVVLRTTARYDAALAALDVAVEIYRAQGDPEAEARATAQIGWAHAYRGTPEEGIARLQPLLEASAASQLSDGVQAALHVAFAQLCQISGRYAEELRAAERAAELARAAEENRLLAQAQVRRGNAFVLMGHLGDGKQALAQALPLLEATGELRSLCFALNTLGGICEERGEHERARASFGQAIEVAESMGDPTVTAFMLSNRGGHAFKTGDWPQARNYLERAVELVREIGASWVSAYPLNALGQLCLAEGRADEGARYVAEAIAMAERSGDLQALQLAHSTLAECELVAGRAQAARDRLEALLDQPAQAGQQADMTLILTPLAWACAALGDEENAACLLERVVEHLPNEGGSFDLADVQRVQALLTLQQGRTQEAEATLDQAVALTHRMGFPYLKAKLLYSYGLLYSAQGAPEQAREQLRAALAILEPLGEQLYAARIEGALADLDGDPLAEIQSPDR